MIETLIEFINNYDFEILRNAILGILAVIGGIYGVVEHEKRSKSERDFDNLTDFMNPYKPMTKEQDAIRHKIPFSTYIMQKTEFQALYRDIQQRGYKCIRYDDEGKLENALYMELLDITADAELCEPEYILNIVDIDDPENLCKYLVSYGTWRHLDIEEAGIVRAERCIHTDMYLECNRTGTVIDSAL